MKRAHDDEVLAGEAGEEEHKPGQAAARSRVGTPAAPALTHPAINSFLKEHHVHELLPVSGVSVVFDAELPVRSAFLALQEHQMVAAPIWDSAAQRLVGMLTVSTFIELLLHHCDEHNHVAVDVGAHTIRQWLDALGRSKKNLITIDPDSSLFTALEYLRMYHIHRLPVVEEGGDDQCVLYVVEHLKILRFLLAHLDKDLPALSLSLGELGVGSYKDVVTCHLNTPLADVLRHQYHNNITALPVVDENGVVLDIIARSDVLCIAHSRSYHDLNITVAQTIALRHEQANSVGSQRANFHLHTCKRADSLISVFEKLSQHDTHRLIVVDDNHRLEGVVSLHDMFNLFLQSAPGQ